ncbi:signal recognition particle 14 kDa protein [Pieris brassicae]|uniref:signal recognition particle 14 kDa protein n=1 Tax=Pieris brassicae TaxID=7116 RepID=UPI001E6626FF|nr:signal recognition particle 14 kDa protein [Pieris brassicae]
MVLLNNEVFLNELTKLFQNARTTGSVTVTMKRYDGRKAPNPKGGLAITNPEYKCLMRAQCHSKKISTVVEQKDVETFTNAYSNLLKTNINGLKRLKKPKKKAMAAQ